MNAEKLTLTLLSTLILSLQPTTHLALQQPSGAKGASNAGALFDKNCAKCHGKDGRAKTVRGKMVGARNLADAEWQTKATDEQIIAAIKKGPGAMPSFEKKLTRGEIDSLAAYVRSLKQEQDQKKK
jgi:mono/diheme cytochrome c family protein